jgi:Nif-specific ferredoxin III
MTDFTVVLPGGGTWVPRFVVELDQQKCIGCGRCFRVCARDVLQLVGITEDGGRLQLDPDGDEDEDEEYEKKVMTIAHAGNCVGCEACSKICPKKCYTHAPAAG